MGWYTSGPSGMEFKYGDVHGLARECGLGEFSIAPRLRIWLEDEEEFYDLEFLSDFQTHAEQLRLPWQHMELEDDFMEASPQESTAELLHKIQTFVQAHLNSIASVLLSHGVENNNSIQSIQASFDAHWKLDRADWPRFLDWINKHLPSPLTMEDLARGSFESEYELPEDKTHLIDKLSPICLLGLLALGTAIVEDDELYLFQPDDDTETEIFKL